MSLIQMSVLGGVLILLIVVVRALALHRLPKAAFLVLWEVAALRLLLPFSVRLPFGTPSPIEHLAVAGEYLTAAVPTKPVSTGAPSAAPAPGSAATHSALPAIWLAGFILMAAYFAVCYVRAKGRFKASCPDNTPAVQNWLSGRKLRRPLEVRQSDLVSSPLTYGILRPVILLPKDMERGDETALTYILTHEFVHIRRFDAVTKLVFAAVLCVHWFNPLVWVMYVLANRDLELSCDECVMDTLGGKEKAPYALTLIAMEEAQSQHLSIHNHFSKLAIEERIEAIMKYKKASVLAMALAVALVFGTTIAFAASARTDSTPSPGGQNAPKTNDVYDHLQAVEGDVMILSKGGEDGEKQYSVDGGQTWLSEEDYRAKFGGSDWQVEWWTAEDYAVWLEEEKQALQSIIGERGYTSGEGWFTWDQKRVDEAIALYEGILENIKNGALYSKTITDKNGGVLEDVMLGSGTLDIAEISTFDEKSAVVPKAVDEAALLEDLKAFGVGGNANLMTYNGQLIRCLVDGVPAGDSGYSIQYVYRNPDGVVDVHTLRSVVRNPDGSYDPMGELIGLAAEGDAGFDQGLIESAAFSGSIQATTAEGTGSGGGTPFEEIFARYRPYGLVYSPRENGMGSLTWNGQAVKSFADMKPDGGAFSYEDPYAESGLMVYTQYGADGRLTGLRAE